MSIINAIESVLWLEVAIIGILFAAQETKARRSLTLFYWATLVIHALIFTFISIDTIPDKPLLFYTIGGAFDFAVIAYTCKIREISKLASVIQDISLASIMFNSLGLFLAYLNKAPELYAALFVPLYGWAIYNLILGEPVNYGRFKIDTRLFAFNRNVYKWDLLGNIKQEKK